MEHDCEIFDDGEAALDGLLSQAKWADADAGMIARLRGMIVGENAPLELEVVAPIETPVVGAMAQAAEVAASVDEPLVPVMARAMSVEPFDKIEQFAEILPIVEVPPAVEVEQPADAPIVFEIPSLPEVKLVIEPPTSVENLPVEEAPPPDQVQTPVEVTIVDQMAPVEEVASPVEDSTIAEAEPVVEMAAPVEVAPADAIPTYIADEATVDIPPVVEEVPVLSSTGFQPVPFPEHGLKTRATQRTRPSLAPLLAIAASFVIMIGVAALLVHRAVRNDVSRNASGNRWSQRSLPGRAANPYELWMISPAAEKRRIAEAKQATPIDPSVVRFERQCRESDSASLAKSLLQTNDRDQRVIFAELISRRDGMDRYLDLIRNPSTRGRAIEALNGMPNPPTEALLAQLNSPTVARRFAAAKALGTLSNEQTLSQLRRMIEQGDHRREALAVLGECRDPAAQQYVREIRTQPALASEFNVVTMEMKQLF